MKKISETVVLEFKYDSEEERAEHVRQMEADGYDCSGQVRKSDDSLMDKNRKFYWYAKFGKRS